MTRTIQAVRVGLFGGTFNPIHVGHLRAAEEVAEALGLARLVFVPSAAPPHKQTTFRDVIAPARERLDWVRLAVANNPRFEVDPLEIERGGASYSVDTLAEYASRLAPLRPVFVIGLDAFAEIGTWREPERIFELTHFAVTARPPVKARSLASWLPACLRGKVELEENGGLAVHRVHGGWIRLLTITALDVSASDIRRRLREGRSVRYLLPKAVNEAVLKSGVYDAVRGRREWRPTLSQDLDAIARARLAVEAALERKAENVIALDVRGIASFTDAFVVATGTSDRHVRSIADGIERALKESGQRPLGVEGQGDGRWVLIDLGDVVVHVFLGEVRAYYDLERLWSDAQALDLAPQAARSNTP